MKDEEELKDLLMEYEERIANLKPQMECENNESFFNDLCKKHDILTGAVANLKYILEIDEGRL